MDFILLTIGLLLIIKSADTLIDSSSKIALKYGVSSFVVGITVVAFGTSAPELAVGIISGINKTNQLSLGNIIGSSFANAALIIGITTTILPLSVKSVIIKREMPLLILIQGIFSVMILNDGILSGIEGFILCLLFIGFIIHIIKGKKEDGEDNAGEKNIKKLNCGGKKEYCIKLWVQGILSLIGLFIGGKFTVDSSTQIALSLGLNETIIGLTIIAVGTTLPELVTGFIAIKKKEPDIILGNYVGGNIFNILLVLGSSALLNPIAAAEGITFDLVYMLLLSLSIFIISLFLKRIPRLCGIILMLSYVFYLSFKIALIFS